MLLGSGEWKASGGASVPHSTDDSATFASKGECSRLCDQGPGPEHYSAKTLQDQAGKIPK